MPQKKQIAPVVLSFFVFLINNFLVQEKKTQRELEELRSTFFIKELSQRDYILYLPLCQSLS